MIAIIEKARKYLTKVAFVGVEPNSKSVYITNGVSRSSTPSDGRESEEDWCFFLCGVQKRCSSDVRPIAIGSEYAVGTSSSGMHCAFGNSLVICILI
jgi:hypothetical protein